MLPARDAPWPLVLLVRTGGDQPDDDLRLLAETAGSRCRSFEAVTLLGTESIADVAHAVRLVVDSFEQGRYVYSRYRSSDRATGGEQTLTIADARLRDASVAVGIRECQIVNRWTGWVRDLVNTPARDLTPEELASEVASRAAEVGVATRRLRGSDQSDGSWDALDAVGAGSAEPPVMLEVRYEGASPTAPLLGLVGKGVTFDSGGLDLKTAQQMRTMKQDMAGAAVVAGTTFAAAQLGLAVRVTAMLALVENMTGGRAVRPGDVVRHRDGSTTEVISPDAEGRLILADALHHLSEQRPEAMLDVATLTGGGGMGPDLWAIVGNDRALVQAVLDSGESVGDHGWELPLVPGYRRFLQSPVADRRNTPTPTRYGFETLAAAAFLADFVGTTPWAHLDISAAAGSWDEGAECGATGRPLRAVVEWMADRAGEGSS